MKGVVDYDYKNDILFFKTNNRSYKKSIELDNIVLDIDQEGLITGIQIFDASIFLKVNKIALKEVLNWEFSTKVERIPNSKIKTTKIEIRLIFKVKIRNNIIEKNPIIIPGPTNEPLKISELVCTA